MGIGYGEVCRLVSRDDFGINAIEMTRMKVTIRTIGCRANQADSATLGRCLDPSSVTIVDGFAGADVVVINTCCVTAEAERDCRKMARRALREAPGSRVVLTGCAVTAIENFGKDIEGDVEVRGGGDVPMEELAAWINGKKEIGPDRDIQSFSGAGRSRALLKVQNGCDHHCAYCVVPAARGPERSMPMDEVLDNVDRIASSGYRELVLTGVQMGAWGRDLPHGHSLAKLVEAVADRFDVGRIRLSSLEPWSVGEDLIDVMAGHGRICPHLHIPMQSGDDGILEAMGRGYTSADLVRVIERARAVIPDLAVGTDVLCGFPGETDAAFDNTLALLREIKPFHVHAFPYSSRPGTRAATMSGQQSRQVARERVRVVLGLGEEMFTGFVEGQIGKVREVIVEGRRSGEINGLTDNFIQVALSGGDPSPGALVTGRLTNLPPGEHHRDHHRVVVLLDRQAHVGELS